jgi:hypothetical protein
MNLTPSLAVLGRMNARLQNREVSLVATVVAPEDLRGGDFVAVLAEIVELPTFLWNETLCGQGEMVRIRRLPTEERVPLKVKAICLPFVFVKQPNGRFQTIDVRLASLVRLERNYAKRVWKTLRTPPARRGVTC